MSQTFSIELSGSAALFLGFQSGFGYSVSWCYVGGHFVMGGAPFSNAPTSYGVGVPGAALMVGATGSSSPTYLTTANSWTTSVSAGEIIVGGVSQSYSIKSDGSHVFNVNGSPVVTNGVFFGVGVGYPIGASVNPTFTTFHTNSWVSFGSPIFTGIYPPRPPAIGSANDIYHWSYQNPYPVYDPSGFLPPTFSGYTGPNTPAEMGPGPGMGAPSEGSLGVVDASITGLGLNNTPAAFLAWRAGQSERRRSQPVTRATSRRRPLPTQPRAMVTATG